MTFHHDGHEAHEGPKTQGGRGRRSAGDPIAVRLAAGGGSRERHFVSFVVFVIVVIFVAADIPRADAQQAPAGSLRGRVEIKREMEPVARRPTVNALGTPGARDLPDRRRAVVYLETAPGGAFEEREPVRARMDQRNETFLPHVLAITAGTVVDFPNNDSTYHNVFSLSKARQFDLGRYAQGRSKSVRFDRPGIVRVFCDIHSHMSAFILVFSHRYFATTDAEGRYRIDRIPAGTYTAIAWHEGANRASRTITIPEAGSLELDFVVP